MGTVREHHDRAFVANRFEQMLADGVRHGGVVAGGIHHHTGDVARVATKHGNAFGCSCCNLCFDLVRVGTDDDDGIGFSGNRIFHATGHLTEVAFGVDHIGFPTFFARQF